VRKPEFHPGSRNDRKIYGGDMRRHANGIAAGKQQSLSRVRGESRLRGAGRNYLMMDRTEEANAALTEALRLRPGSTVSNIVIPTKNASPAYIEARNQADQALFKVGLPAR
jgi:hypothetical protein